MRWGIFFVLLLLSSSSAASATNKDDEIALLKIKRQLGDPAILGSWVKGFDFCNVAGENGKWYIGCTSSGRVNVLSMSLSDNVTAPFPGAICGLTELQDLVISMIPGLYGSIPSCVADLNKLASVVITGTSLSGPVPSFASNANLRTITLPANRLSGTIPSSLSTLPNLNTLVLAGNNLTGTIPPGIVHGSLPTLSLSGNSLSGELPRCYGWVDFRLFDVGGNHISGDASFLFGAQKKTSNIFLSDNEFEFDLSYVEFSDDLFGFDLSHNRIYGKVPDSLATAAALYYPNLSFNRLCGELPQGGNMGRFSAADFANNTCLCGYPLPPCSTAAPAAAPISV